ncbi:TPA: hypothetical protein U1364_001739 [Streptococcus suis]|uniref:hypothetical protein n=1 Tax=Streptococcus suis TaxID=1307 RepID=UPI0004054F97|nr:hypothetical protein [Streptococcus suis]HEM3214324.1 hypothetical protein [Streptococcus suis 12814]HEM4253900.1 hypothetical protein [Streptococcus suis]HEM5199076.1 hypothetical protein [Streptococcus suis]HEM5313321.1 hypothetical protein [Streptococcus suis]
MDKIKTFFNKFLSFKWYYQLLIALVTVASMFALYKLLSWILPFILGGSLLIWVITDGEAFSMMWNSYKQSKQAPLNPLLTSIYHWLTETGVSDLPIATMQFTQGVEFPDGNQGLYFIHLEKEVSNELLWNFETKVRQAVKSMSNELTDCVVSRSKREPYLAIKVRLVSASEMLLQKNQAEEDF